MWWKRSVPFWTAGLAIGSSILAASLSGWGAAPSMSGREWKRMETEKGENGGLEETHTKLLDQIQSCQEFCTQGADILRICGETWAGMREEGGTGDLENVEKLIERLGENGHVAVDDRNRVNMCESGQMLAFCAQVETGQRGRITVASVNTMGSCVLWNLCTQKGEVRVLRSNYSYRNGRMEKKAVLSYLAENWEYTPEGYVLFSGSCFSEELYTLSMSRAEEHTAFRVLPLDDVCRQLGRKYLEPVGFAYHNLFLTSWSEEDFGKLDFYDLFDLFYERVMGRPMPYVMDENSGIGAVYRIPAAEFERVILARFRISRDTLRQKTVFHPEDHTYEYKPRGFYEREYPEYPYSEVVEFAKNGDGTLTLTANVVFPYEGTSRAYSHEVRVRPLEDGGVQYVSNRVLPGGSVTGMGPAEAEWHTPRLTREEWEAVYQSHPAEGEACGGQTARSGPPGSRRHWNQNGC